MAFLSVQSAQASGTVAPQNATLSPGWNGTFNTAVGWDYWYDYSNGGHFATAMEACKLFSQANTSLGASNPAAGYQAHNCLPAGGTAIHDMYCPSGYTKTATSTTTAICVGTVQSCPANSTGTTTCTCTDPYVPNGNALSCIVPSYRGSSSVTVCDATGLCSGAVYSTAAAACQSFVTNIAGGGKAEMVGSVCKLTEVFSDGSTKISYKTINNVNACAAGDTACSSAAASSVAATNTLASASNVAAASTLAAGAAYAAAILAGASSSVAAAQSQQAAAQAAADLTAATNLPTDYNRESTQQQIKSNLDSIKSQGDTTGTPFDIGAGDQSILSQAEIDKNSQLARVNGIAAGADPIPLSDNFFASPFPSPAACAPLTFNWGGALTAGTRAFTWDICSHVEAIKSIFSWVVSLLVGALIFSMLMGLMG